MIFLPGGKAAQPPETLTSYQGAGRGSGVISSNGVNGARGDEKSPGYGIQVGCCHSSRSLCTPLLCQQQHNSPGCITLQGDFELSLTQIGYLPAAFLARHIPGTSTHQRQPAFVHLVHLYQQDGQTKGHVVCRLGSWCPRLSLQRPASMSMRFG